MEMIKSKKFPGVYHTVLKNGDLSYYIYYRDPYGKQHKVKIGKKSEYIDEAYCNRIRLNTIVALKNGELPPNIQIRKKHKIISLNSVADFYFTNVKNKSTHKWQNKYNLRIRDSIGEKDIELIGSKEMLSLQQSMIDDNLAPSTINCYMDIVSAVCNYALKTDMYKGMNPTKLIKKLKVDNNRQKFLSQNEINDLLECVKSEPTLYLFTKLSLSTGGRFQSILSIKKRDVNLTDKIITLKDYKNESTYNGYICDNELSDLLKTKMSLIGNNDYVVFDNGIKDMRKYISRKMSSIFYELFNIYDLDETDKDYRKHKVVIHTLRHTFLSHLALKGTSPFEIKQLSNHKSLKMVERYAKLNPDSGKDKVVGLYS
ncbi:site-specific integrase [uncultured Desulfobacter sp.]|uniref:tyrosine-type recombinase/integrase n=1 Tax=uncultured Desulfobacter sp. TaxID=240139 RepID=UPI0029C6622A|nr:site-specific integrase [uncultured Desulfobacter sp.]